jgi:hypothetical protein
LKDYLGLIVDVATGEAEFATPAEKQSFTDANAKRIESWKRSSSFTLYEEVTHTTRHTHTHTHDTHDTHDTHTTHTTHNTATDAESHLMCDVCRVCVRWLMPASEEAEGAVVHQERQGVPLRAAAAVRQGDLR